MARKAFSRIDRSLLGRWWWTIDRWILGGALALLALGALLSVSASPMVAHRIGAPDFFFVKRHLLMVVPSLLLMISVSLFPSKLSRYAAWLIFLISLGFLFITPLIGAEIKGSRRWVNVAGFSLQASEFIKPSFALVAAWLFSQKGTVRQSRAWSISLGIYILVVALLMLQPDFGMAFVVTGIWGAQLFLAGFPFVWIFVFLICAVLAGVGAYFIFPHVASRIDRFWGGGADQGDLYQVSKSLEALKNGGFLGQGPGEGILKRHLPDAHADFVFSVAGEEFGYILCVLILALYMLILGRAFFHIYREKNLFISLAVSGLMVQYALQAFINIASALHLIPTKGMTLPFLSYGGSSMLAVSLGMGLLLSLTRKTAES